MSMIPQFLIRRRQDESVSVPEDQNTVYVVEPTSTKVLRGIDMQIEKSKDNIAHYESEVRRRYEEIANFRERIADEAAVVEVMEVARDQLKRAPANHTAMEGLQTAIERELEVL